jgi:tetratricopeptide (TPR) repeat protein
LGDTAFDRAEQLPAATLPPALEISDSRLVTEEGIAVEPLDWSPTADDADPHIQIENTLEDDIDASEVDKNSDEPQPDLDPEYADDSESERSSPATAPAFVAHGNRMIRVDTMKQPQPASRIASRAKPEDMLAAARDSLARTSLVEAAGYYEQLAAKNKRLEEVIADLETAIQVHPASQRLYEALGMAYTNKGNIPGALEAYRKALASIG